jgi:hypothetical protein
LFSACGTTEQLAEKVQYSGKIDEEHTSEAKARVDSVDVIAGMNPWPTARMSFSASCEVVP